MQDNNVYECNLYSITSDIEIDSNLNMRKNIDNAPIEIVSKIMVQPTRRKNIYREIMTGVLIPAVVDDITFNPLTGDQILLHRSVPKSPVFIYVQICHVKNAIPRKELEIIDTKRVQEYYDTHRRNNLKSELNDIFNTANEYYNNALQNNMTTKKSRVLFKNNK